MREAMKIFKDAVVREYNSCPPFCRLCEEACARREGNGPLGATTIHAVDIPEVNFHSVIACLQCSIPRCVEICPTGAIAKDEVSGVVRIQKEQCVGCGLCTLECQYGGVYYSSEKQKSIKCDTCGGEPKCVIACPYGVLEYVKNREILERLHEEDFLSPGVRSCAGCMAELGLRLALRVLGPNTVLFGAPGCVFPVISGEDAKSSTKVATFPCLFTNVISTMTGVFRYFRLRGKSANLLAFVGDGCLADIGLQTLSGAAERGENLIVIVYDNEGYMNTGVQRSSTTPYFGWTNTSLVGGPYQGKAQKSKYMPFIMLSHEIPYVATANVAYLDDFTQKLTKAMTVKDGLSYIHLFSPCPVGWRASSDSGITISRLAVETNYFPLWEAENGKVILTHEISHPKPIEEYTKLMGRFSHLTKENLHQFQVLVNKRLDLIKSFIHRGEKDKESGLGRDEDV
jgi:phenylglyoxylate dehydrogenase beta subunit